MMFPVILFLIIVIILISSSVKICGEAERLAVYRLGRMMPLRGPGLVLIIPNIERSTRVRIGERAEIIDNMSAKFKDISIPISSAESCSAGTMVQIIGFEGPVSQGKAKVLRDTDSRREFACEKCGHVMRR